MRVIEALLATCVSVLLAFFWMRGTGVDCQALPPCTIEAQRAGLSAMYDVFHGDYWFNNTGWNTAGGACIQDTVSLGRGPAYWYMPLTANLHACMHAWVGHAIQTFSCHEAEESVLICSTLFPTTAAGLG